MIVLAIGGTKMWMNARLALDEVMFTANSSPPRRRTKEIDDMIGMIDGVGIGISSLCIVHCL